MLIPLDLYRCLGHGLKMCLFFGHKPQIIFGYFFHKMNLSHFYRYKVSCVFICIMKVSKGAKIKNRYNQVPHLSKTNKKWRGT